MFPSFLSNPALWLIIAVVAVIVKVLCTAISLRWPGGAEGMLASPMGKRVYFAGKLTPVIAVGAVLMRVNLSGPGIGSAWSVPAFAGLIAIVALVVWLRLTKRWYGIAHMIKSSRPRGGS